MSGVETQVNDALKPFLGTFPRSPTPQVEKASGSEEDGLIDSGTANHEEVANEIESSFSSICTESSSSEKTTFLYSATYISTLPDNAVMVPNSLQDTSLLLQDTSNSLQTPAGVSAFAPSSSLQGTS